jgi:hypothetical protein
MTAEPYFATRLLSVWRTRGGPGFLRFLITRLARIQSDMMFERMLVDQTEPPSFGPDRQIILIDRDNLDDPSLQDVVSQLLTSESSIYRQGLKENDLAFAVVDRERQLLHRTFVQFETSYKTLLGEAMSVPLLTHCHTIPSMRGERLYPQTLLHVGALLRARGYDRMIITCDERNQASIRGIGHGGFELISSIRSLVILARFGIQQIKTKQTVRWRFVRL